MIRLLVFFTYALLSEEYSNLLNWNSNHKVAETIESTIKEKLFH